MSRAGGREHVFKALNNLSIELPSWGFANTGTRFGKFMQPAAATSIAEKLADAGEVHRLTGCCPTVAVHTAWDFPQGLESCDEIQKEAEKHGIKVGSINPTLFEDPDYKFGSLGNPDPAVREKALRHILESAKIGAELGNRDLVLWFADGSNYPGTANVRERKSWFEEALIEVTKQLDADQRMLIEYKPFEPAFYHTDIADWGMALLLAQKAGPQAKVLVDTGHHYLSQNIEQIVAWLLSEEMLGGFHFNDRKYADDDLTVGSIDPYQLFRIFFEMFFYRWENEENPEISFMVDQSHNLKPKIEAMIQTVEIVQSTVAKSSLVDFKKLRTHQKSCDLIDAEGCLQSAFQTDVSPILAEWRASRKLPTNPLEAFRNSGYFEKVTQARADSDRGARGGYT